LKNCRIGIPIPKLGIQKKINVGTQYTSFRTRKNGCRHTYIYSMPVAAVPLSTQHLSRHTYIYSTPVPPYLHLLNACPAIPTSTQRLSRSTQKKRRACFLIHEIRRIDGGRGFRTGRNVFQIGGNIFYNQKNKILMKILEFKRSGIGISAEFRGIPSGFPRNSERISQPSRRLSHQNTYSYVQEENSGSSRKFVENYLLFSCITNQIYALHQRSMGWRNLSKTAEKSFSSTRSVSVDSCACGRG
jgi:hypothetical protein